MSWPFAILFITCFTYTCTSIAMRLVHGSLATGKPHAHLVSHARPMTTREYTRLCERSHLS